MPSTQADESSWPEAMATVTSCTYDVRAGRAIAFGLPSSKHFRIAYNYWAAGAVHTGEFFAEKALPQGSLFPIRYNPETPHENSHGQRRSSPRGSLPRGSLLAVGLVGSVVLSLLWSLVLRGCH